MLTIFLPEVIVLDELDLVWPRSGGFRVRVGLILRVGVGLLLGVGVGLFLEVVVVESDQVAGPWVGGGLVRLGLG